MGFSVSGSAAIIFAAMFIAFGMWYTAASNSFDRVTDAQADRTEDVVQTRNTAISIAEATYNASADAVTIDAENGGTSQIRLGQVDLLVDGRYQRDWQSGATVADDGGTALWLSGETLNVTLGGFVTQPSRVKVVTGTGVAATAGVTAA